MTNSDSGPKPGRARLKLAAVSHDARMAVKDALARRGYLLTKLDDEAQRYVSATHNDSVPLPAGAEEYLRADNPELVKLQAAYDAYDVAASVPTQWNASFLKRNLSLAWFRGDNAYVWQFRQFGTAAEMRMYLALLDAESRDELGLLSTLPEDGLFGAWTFEFGQRPAVSRDLLDSVNEINYLEEHIGLSSIDGLRVLDIGAGYGRMAHRVDAAMKNLARYDCIDAVATSTFLCDYYRTFRELSDAVRVVPLTEHETLADAYDVAINIHSFSECSLAAIQWWADRIAERDIEWLLIVPNTGGDLLSTEASGDRLDFRPVIEGAGYELVDQRPIYGVEELRELIDVDNQFMLFRRRST